MNVHKTEIIDLCSKEPSCYTLWLKRMKRRKFQLRRMKKLYRKEVLGSGPKHFRNKINFQMA